mgnify:CR=1 FL=1
MKTPRLILFFIFSILISKGYGQCFDMSDLHNSNVTCTTGSYGNPYASTGVVSGRHTVMSKVNDYDPNVPQLLTIPRGETNSIRLGNDRTGAEAESITFLYTVDSKNPILLLKYAAVMEDPGHDSAGQPRLQLQVLTNDEALIDPNCTSFDFIASPDLGWNSMHNGGLLWKDWTFIGVDLSSYIGQTIKIRLTNYDCAYSGHYGYAYFHLSCAPKQIKSEACGNVSSVTFSAPLGFTYYWYTLSGGTKISKGTGQTLTVPMDGTQYYCDISQIGKPECSYTNSIIAQPRYPIADFSIRQVQGCADTLYLNNLSAVSIDGIRKNSPTEDCDEAIWNLGDGRIIDTYQLVGTPITYNNGGTYTITLTARLKNGECSHSISQQVTVRGTNDPHTGYLHSTICENSFYRFDGKNLSKTGTYTQHTQTPYGCDSTTILYLTANPVMEHIDTLYLCKNETFSFQGQTITHAGTYYAKYQNTFGCDSIYKLIVREVPIYYHEESATICDNEIYNFNGRLLQQSGVYIDSAQSIYGCDSVIKLTLQVYPTYLFDTYVETCHDDTFTFRNRIIEHPGIFYDSLLTHHGCDSIYRLIYNKTPIFQFDAEATIFQGETYFFQGKQFADSGLHVITYRTTSGCDSVYRLKLHVLPRYFFKETASICDTAPYQWRNHYFYETGMYYDSLRTIGGHDSIYMLDLTVNKSYLIPLYIETCEGQSFDFRGKTITQPGVYYDSLYTHQGCDSVFKLIYNVVPTYHFYDTAYFCLNSTYNFRGKLLTNPGIYYDTLKTISGCDSIFELRLFSYNSFLEIDSAIVCENEPYLWRGRQLSTHGIYADTFQTANGCDSVFMLKLKTIPTYFNNRYISLCPNETFSIRGQQLSAPAIYYDTIVSSIGCDSIIRYIISNNPDYIQEQTITICPSDTYNFRGRMVSKQGTYVDTLHTNVGCDSIFRLILKHHPLYEFKMTDTVYCTNLPYIWRGKEYDASGVYYDSLVATTGCDSVYILKLTVYNSYTFTTIDSICDIHPYLFRGKIYTSTGIYYDSLTTIAGCDSIYKLILNVFETQRDTLSNSICYGDTFHFANRFLSTPGQYIDTICSPYEMNCKISVLNLDVLFPTEIYYAHLNDICADDSIYEISFRYRGPKPLTYNLLYDTNAQKQGFRNVLDKPFTDSIVDIIPHYPHKAYIRPDKYFVRLEFNNGACIPSKYGIDIPFIVRYPSWIIEQNWNNVIALLNEQHNGGYNFSNYVWYINGRKIDYATGAYLYCLEIQVGDEVVLYPTRIGEDYAIPTCPIVITDKNNEEQNDAPIFIYPSAVSSANARIKIQMNKGGAFYLYNTRGEIIYSENCSYEQNYEIILPSIAGVYLLTYRNSNEEIYTSKILVY